jgi:glutamine transport system permease protein
MFNDFLSIVLYYSPQLLRGALHTIWLAIVGVSLGFVVGTLTSLPRVYKIPILNQLAHVYVEVYRGTPLLVQIFFLFFGIPTVTGVTIEPVTAGIAAIALNSGAYFSEILRGAILAIPKGQVQAARAMGLSGWKTLRYVVALQALHLALPALGNQAIISLKDTSLLAVISVVELTRSGQLIISDTFLAFQIWFLVALLYFVITSVLSLILRKTEVRINRFIIES